ncbi:hypothetical protein EV426DRAFT_717190 [Tirmania nivea]|nr:hypothetical protein EV426DRAFT_717190 [Tirmania nivea]
MPTTPIVFSANNFAVLLILISIPKLANAQGDNPTRNIPLPLPESEWAGKSNLNYTELYYKYSEVLTCLYIPVGVLGYFWWFSTSLMNVVCVIKCMVIVLQEKRLTKNREQSTPLSYLACGIFTVGWSIYSIIAGFKSLNSCSDLSGFSAVHSYIIMNIFAGISSGIGGLLFTFSWCKPIKGFLCSAALLHNIALHLQYVSGPVLFFSVTKSAGIFRKIINKPDLVRLGAILACILPSEIFVLPIAVGLLFTTGPFAIITIPLAAVAVAMCGSSNVLLGKIMGDPTGKYWLNLVWGKFTASMAALGPIIEAGHGYDGDTMEVEWALSYWGKYEQINIPEVDVGVAATAQKEECGSRVFNFTRYRTGKGNLQYYLGRKCWTLYWNLPGAETVGPVRKQALMLFWHALKESSKLGRRFGSWEEMDDLRRVTVDLAETFFGKIGSI